MNIKNLLSFIAFTFLFGAFGQNNSAIDSLENILRTATADTAKVNCLNALSNQYRIISDHKVAMQYAEFAFDLATTLSYKKGIADAYKSIGYIYEEQGNDPEALENYFAWLKISEEIGDKKGIADASYWIGYIYEQQQKYQVALELYSEALKIYKEIWDKKGIANIYKHYGHTYWIQGNHQKLMEILREELKIYKEIGDKKAVADKYYWIGHFIEYNQCNYPEAMESYSSALKVFLEIGNKNGIANCYNKIGNIYLSQGNLPEAMENYLSSLKFFEEIGDKQGISNCYNNIAIIYEYQGNYQEALKNNFASLRIKEEIGFKRGIADSYFNIGNIYSSQGNYTEALENYFTCLKIEEEIDYKEGIAEVCHSISSIYLKQGIYSEALEYSLTCLNISEETGYKRYIALSYHNIGNIYKNQGNYKDARKYLIDGLTLSKEIGNKQGNKDNYYSLSLLDSTEGNFAQALEHYKMHTLYKDSLFNEESENQLAEMEIRYETEKKDREIELLNKDKALQEQRLEKQRLVRNGTIAGAMLLLLIGLLFFRSFRLRKKLEKQQAIAQERHRISADLHDDVGSGLSRIMLLSELMKKDAKTPESRKEAERVAAISHELSSNINEIVWALNSNNDYVENLVAYIRRYASEYFENSSVKLIINTPVNMGHTYISGEHRRNIFFAVKEALHNIIKHAMATEARLNFTVKHNVLSIVINDNGKGFNEEELNKFGNGLNNMRNRMKNINGNCIIENHKGARITMTLPV